jgi:hypothetical protein
MYFTEREHPRARIEHWCTTCCRRIDPGETYWRGRGYDGGEAWTWRSCEHCMAVTRIYDPRDHDDLFSESGMHDWIDNGARDIAELRHMVGYRMRWRTKTGALLTVPIHTNGDRNG